MSFQAYLDNIEVKTGKKISQLKALAEQKGFTEGDRLRKGVKAQEIIDWLHQDFDLGRGHAMTIVAVLKGDERANGR